MLTHDEKIPIHVNTRVGRSCEKLQAPSFTMCLGFLQFTALKSCALSEIIHKTSNFYLPVFLREIVHERTLLRHNDVIKNSSTKIKSEITPVN